MLFKESPSPDAAMHANLSLLGWNVSSLQQAAAHWITSKCVEQASVAQDDARVHSDCMNGARMASDDDGISALSSGQLAFEMPFLNWCHAPTFSGSFSLLTADICVARVDASGVKGGGHSLMFLLQCFPGPGR